MSEPPVEVYCPTCRTLYGTITRKQVTDLVWENVCTPSTIPKYCTVCECPTERKPR